MDLEAIDMMYEMSRCDFTKGNLIGGPLWSTKLLASWQGRAGVYLISNE